MSRVELPVMELTDVGGIDLEVHDSGSGEPVVFVHAMREDWHGVLAESALTERHRLVYYYRRGFGRSSGSGLPLTVAQHAGDCRAVMRHLGIDQAHVVGLSAGGALVLQFAVDFPEAAHTAAVLEPTVPGLLSEDPEFEQMQAKMAERFEAGDTAGALEVLLDTMGGGDYAADFERTLPPGWFDRIVADWETFRHDVAALAAWEFTEKGRGEDHRAGALYESNRQRPSSPGISPDDPFVGPAGGERGGAGLDALHAAPRPQGGRRASRRVLLAPPDAQLNTSAEKAHHPRGGRRWDLERSSRVGRRLV